MRLCVLLCLHHTASAYLAGARFSINNTACHWKRHLAFSEAERKQTFCGELTREKIGAWFQSQMKSSGGSVSEDEYDCVHLRRYVLSVAAVAPYLCGARNTTRVLDLASGIGAIARGVLHFFPALQQIDSTSFDLRKPFPLPDGGYDLVLHNEILEHLKDLESSRIEELSAFKASGILTNLREVARILKPGGRLFLSTPNLNSYKSIHNLLQHRHAFAFSPHPRELAFEDVAEFVRTAGLSIEVHETVNSWHNHRMAAPAVAAIQDFLKAHPQYKSTHREDDTFVIARSGALPNAVAAGRGPGHGRAA